jgi:hypothetical protein
MREYCQYRADEQKRYIQFLVGRLKTYCRSSFEFPSRSSKNLEPFLIHSFSLPVSFISSGLPRPICCWWCKRYCLRPLYRLENGDIIWRCPKFSGKIQLPQNMIQLRWLLFYRGLNYPLSPHSIISYGIFLDIQEYVESQDLLDPFTSVLKRCIQTY